MVNRLHAFYFLEHDVVSLRELVFEAFNKLDLDHIWADLTDALNHHIRDLLRILLQNLEALTEVGQYFG